MTGVYVVFQLPCQFYTIHLGHHDVAHDDVGNVDVCEIQSFRSVGSLQYLEIISQGVGDILSDITVVFYDQQYGALVGIRLDHLQHIRLLFVVFFRVFFVQGIRIGIVGQDREGEFRSFSQTTVYRQRTLMQVG